jgi:hypothetical protein
MAGESQRQAIRALYPAVFGLNSRFCASSVSPAHLRIQGSKRPLAILRTRGLRRSAEGEKIGRIVIGRGSLTWFGGKRQKGTRISWSKFAELMKRHCYHS